MNNIFDTLNAHWSEVIDSVITELSLTKISGDIWLKPLRIHDVTDNTIIITTDNEQYDYNYVSKKYGIHIKSAVSDVCFCTSALYVSVNNIVLCVFKL